MKAWFKDWFNSPYYHMLYKNRTQHEADEFVQQCVQQFNIQPQHRLLDVACGKGRHAKAFASYGIDVTGIDLAEDSILEAKQFEHDRLHFFVHDMREIFRTNYYDVVTNMFTSFGYFDQPQDNTKTAKMIHSALRPGGKFIMDFVNQQHAYQVIQAQPDDLIVENGIRFTIHKRIDQQRLIKEIGIEDGERKECFQEELNSFSFNDMVALFEDNGLTFRKAYGDYQLSAYSEMDSPRMILLFEK